MTSLISRYTDGTVRDGPIVWFGVIHEPTKECIVPHIPINLPSGSTAFARLPLAVGLIVYALVQLGRAPSAPYLPK